MSEPPSPIQAFEEGNGLTKALSLARTIESVGVQLKEIAELVPKSEQ